MYFRPAAVGVMVRKRTVSPVPGSRSLTTTTTGVGESCCSSRTETYQSRVLLLLMMPTLILFKDSRDGRLVSRLLRLQRRQLLQAARLLALGVARLEGAADLRPGGVDG